MEGGSLFGQVAMAPPDPVFGVQSQYKADPSAQKVDLSVGAYRTDEGRPLVLACVREAERRMLADASLNKEYLPMEGLAEFRDAAAELLFGADAPARPTRVVTVQSVSGTGGVRLAAEFLAAFLPPLAAAADGSRPRRTAYVTNPTWGNHNQIFGYAGFQVCALRYWDAAARGLAFAALLEDLAACPPGSVVVLHSCAHNPTGVDPTHAQWERILDVIAAHALVPVFDTAYQGFATGDLDADAFVVRAAYARGLEFVATQSFAKNMGLYAERVGAMHVALRDGANAAAVLSQLKRLVRGMYSNPPVHGARIAAMILRTPDLHAMWLEELRGMSGRIAEMRRALHAELVRLGAPAGAWDHVLTQIGMFSFTGLSVEACDSLVRDHHIYLLNNGRISVPGLTSATVPYVANAIHVVTTPQNK